LSVLIIIVSTSDAAFAVSTLKKKVISIAVNLIVE